MNIPPLLLSCHLAFVYYHPLINVHGLSNANGFYELKKAISVSSEMMQHVANSEYDLSTNHYENNKSY